MIVDQAAINAGFDFRRCHQTRRPPPTNSRPGSPPPVMGPSAAAGAKGVAADAVAEDIVVIDDDVANVDADPKFDPVTQRHRRILVSHAALHFNGTAYRIHGTGKLDQHTVTSGLDDAPAMRRDGGIDEGLPDCL
jgi:hypothetical protein